MTITICRVCRKRDCEHLLDDPATFGLFITSAEVGEVEQLAPGEVLDMASNLILLDEQRELEALVPCMHQSAQDTLAALRKAGFRIVKEARP